MKKARIRVEHNYHGKKAIMVELYDKKTYEMESAFPIENFKINGDLPLRLLLKIAELQNLGYKTEIILYAKDFKGE